MLLCFGAMPLLSACGGKNAGHTRNETKKQEEDITAVSYEASDFTPTTVVDTEQLAMRVTAVEIEDDSCTLLMEIENKSADTPYSISTEEGYINGVQFERYWQEHVQPGETKSSDLWYYASDMRNYDIGEYTDVEFSYAIYDDSDTSLQPEPVAQGMAHVYPYGEERAKLFERTPQDTDVVILDNDQATVTAVGYEADADNYKAALFVQNKTDKRISVGALGVRINGFEGYSAGCSVDAGKCAFCFIDFPLSELEGYGVTDVKDVKDITFNLVCTDGSEEEYPQSQMVTLLPGGAPDFDGETESIVSVDSSPSERISAGEVHTVWIRPDRTATSVGGNQYGQCDVSQWNDLVAVSAASDYTVGLRSDGTVLGAGNYEDEIEDWTDIVAISAGVAHTVGLRSDGTVLAVGENTCGQCDVSGWTDITAVAAGNVYTAGLKKDGTVMVTKSTNPIIDVGLESVETWTDIVAIAGGRTHFVGLKNDGTVVADGDNIQGECEVSDWTDIVAISAGNHFTVGLKSNGTVVAVGSNTSGQGRIYDWTDIVAVSAGANHTIGLKRDDTLVAVGLNYSGQCNVSVQ